jgi:hypothetical protein
MKGQNEQAGVPKAMKFRLAAGEAVLGAGLFVTPLTLIYTAVVYRLFRGKVVEMDYE